MTRFTPRTIPRRGQLWRARHPASGVTALVVQTTLRVDIPGTATAPTMPGPRVADPGDEIKAARRPTPGKAAVRLAPGPRGVARVTRAARRSTQGTAALPSYPARVDQLGDATHAVRVPRRERPR